MKTIFISMFEGNEAKNILRTPITSTLLSQPDVRLVLFMKNQGRIDYYKKEFSDPRLIYEVAPYSRSMGKGLDRIFAILKFFMLKTETTGLRRKMNWEVNKNYFVYYASSILNALLARPSTRKALRFLDFRLVRNRMYAPYFDKYHPALVLLAHLFEEPETHLLREAKKRGIKTVGFINSWDKLTGRCALRLLPKKLVVFNDIVKREAVTHADMKEEDVFVGGLPQYDHYFTSSPKNREDFFSGMDSQKNLLVYAPMGSTNSASDWDMIDLLHKFKDEGRFAKDIEILVRFQPNDFIDELELKKRPWLIYDYPGTRLSSTRGVDWDMSFEELGRLKDTLRHMSLLICYASSLGIDAAIFGKPVININFEMRPEEHMMKSPTRFYKMAHYKNALATGGMRLVNSQEELIYWANLYLNNSRLDEEGRRALVQRQCKFLDGKSGERIGKFLLNQL